MYSYSRVGSRSQHEKQLPEEQHRAKRLVLERPRFDLVDGVLYFCDIRPPYRMRLAIPEKLRPALLAKAHSGRFAGHFTEKGLFGLGSRRYWWDGMRSDVRRTCRSCLPCATRKGPGRHVRPPLKPIPVGGPFARVGVDALQLTPTQKGNRYAFVFMDYLTKLSEVFAISYQSTETIARLMVEHNNGRHGVPNELLSDRGANCLSDLMTEICELTGIKKINTTAYHILRRTEWVKSSTVPCSA